MSRRRNENRRKSLRPLLFLLLAGLALLLSACGSGEEKKLRIVAATFPLYDWAREVTAGAENVELSFLQDSGADLHSYQATAADMVQIASCDLFLYVGGGSDGWVADALKNSKNPERRAVSLMELLGEAALEEEEKEGMQAEEEAGPEEAEKDEHVWLSLKNAAFFTDKIAEVLCALDPPQQARYRENAAAYAEKLNALRGEYEAAAASAETKTLLFGDRFPFLYLAKELGLDYYAAFRGCSAESEASFETIVFLAGKADELGLRVILRTETGDGRLAETIRSATAGKDQTILTLDSLQSVTKVRAAEGVTYLSVMQANLEVLKQAMR